MQALRKVKEDITWVGSNDRRLELFENLFPIPNGISYNSYVITDEKTALVDTEDSSVLPQFEQNVLAALDGRKLDYLVINHMEPDHCAGIVRMLELFPQAKMVGNPKTFAFFEQIYDTTLPEERKITVKEGDTLTLGRHELTFVMAPMVHWPEVMMTYDKTDKILFSADAFGSFGALNGNLFDDEVDFDARWLEEARRYYTNIVGKYGRQVQAVLKKASGLDIQMLAGLHGPVWRKNLDFILDKYQHWSTYTPEDPKSVVIFYASMYGNTESMVEALSCQLAERGVHGIKSYDVSKTDKSYLIAEAFRAGYLVFASVTYNNGLYPKMREFIEDMAALNVQNRKATILGNGTWMPQSEKIMREMLGDIAGFDVSEKTVVVKSSLPRAQAGALGEVADDIVERIGE